MPSWTFNPTSQPYKSRYAEKPSGTGSYIHKTDQPSLSKPRPFPAVRGGLWQHQPCVHWRWVAGASLWWRQWPEATGLQKSWSPHHARTPRLPVSKQISSTFASTIVFVCFLNGNGRRRWHRERKSGREIREKGGREKERWWEGEGEREGERELELKLKNFITQG